MIDRIPSGTRDVLPDEMRELRAITERLRAEFESAGYGEVYTPALEYESTLGRGESTATIPAYRVFDEQGLVLALRSDMTVPIARLVATRYATAARLPPRPPPARSAARVSSGRGRARRCSRTRGDGGGAERSLCRARRGGVEDL
jgi:hypothetical protein